MDSLMPGVRELARQSAFVGFVDGNPNAIVTQDATQFIYVSFSDTIQGRRPDEWKDEWKKVSYLYVAPSHRLGYTNRLPERSAALIFAKRGMAHDRPGWVVIAQFPVRYTPAPGKRMLGTIGGGMYGPQSLTISEVHQLLPAAIRGNAEAARRLDPVLASISQAVDRLPRPLQHDSLMAETRAIAAQVEPGTPRSEIEKLFPQQDAGLSVSTSARYYREPEVMIEVPYDLNGGAWKPTNRVNGPLRVYRDGYHAG